LVDKIIHCISRAISQSGEFHEAQQISIHFRAFADEVIEAVSALKPQRSMVDDLVM
jgi:hypothetical protein